MFLAQMRMAAIASSLTAFALAPGALKTGIAKSDNFFSMPELIPQDLIDDLVQRIDVVEVIGNRLEIKKAGKEYKGLCPFHTEKTPSFTVSPDKGFYHCFGCGAHGTALGFLIDFDRLTFIEAIEELAKIAGVTIPKTKQGRSDSVKNKNLQDLLLELMSHYIDNLSKSKKAIEYLKT